MRVYTGEIVTSDPMQRVLRGHKDSWSKILLERLFLAWTCDPLLHLSACFKGIHHYIWFWCSKVFSLLYTNDLTCSQWDKCLLLVLDECLVVCVTVVEAMLFKVPFGFFFILKSEDFCAHFAGFFFFSVSCMVTVSMKDFLIRTLKVKLSI